MNKINIPFRGMTNVPDDSYSQDGSMSVLLNMRHKGGELVQCQPPTEDLIEDFEGNVRDVKKALYHSQSKHWLELTDDGIYDKTASNEKNEHIYITRNRCKSFALMGNMVVMYFEDSVEYAIWRGKEYLLLGRLPEPLRLVISGKQKVALIENVVDSVDINSPNYQAKCQKGAVDKALATVYKDRGYVDRAWFRIAVKLFDGTYISVSEIYALSNFKDSTFAEIKEFVGDVNGAQVLWHGKDSQNYYTALDYFIPEFEIGGSLGGWKDVVSAIEIFSTGSIMSSSVKFLGPEDNVNESLYGVEYWKPMKAMELKDALINAEYFKVAEFSVEGRKIWEISETSPSRIAVQNSLKNVVVHSVIANNPYVYNAKLHASGYKEVFFEGYSSGVSNYFGTEKEKFANEKGDFWTVVTHIKADDGLIVVKREDRPYEESTTERLAHLDFLSYPDSRAFKMDLYDKKNKKKLSVPLTPHPTRNEAIYLQTESIFQVVRKKDYIGYEVDYNLFDIPHICTLDGWMDYDESKESLPEDNVFLVKDNTVKVSAVDNPFYFPTAQTYKFEGDIVALASNAEAISTGQFGQYPLFVFTTEGIWAMQVDASGQGAYTTQSPFSREVCNGSVCPVSGGIVFTTERGVMAISGGQVTELSLPLDGLAPNYMDYDEDFWEGIFIKAGLDHYIEPVDIRHYVDNKKTKLAYNYLHNEVIVSCIDFDYSFVYSLTNQEWSIIDRVFDITTNSYPELVVYNNDKKLMYKFKEGNDKVPVVAITRPVKVDTLDFKRLRQAALRCTFEGSLNFYVLGSNDGARFVCITGKECPTKSEVDSGITSVSTQRDLITSMSRSKQYKYIAIAVAGNMKGRISLAEMLVEGGFASNQLR